MRWIRNILVTVGACVVAVSPLVLAAIAHPTPIDWSELRFDAPPPPPPPARTEIEFLAQYEHDGSQATAFSHGYRRGTARRIGQQMGRDAVRNRYGPRDVTPDGPAWMPSYGYHGPVARSVADAQAPADWSGEPVDVVIG